MPSFRNGKGLKQIIVRQQTYEGPNHIAVNMSPAGNWLQNTPPPSSNTNREIPRSLPPKLPRRPTLTEANLEGLETVNLSGPEWNIKMGNEPEEIPEVLKMQPKRQRQHRRTRQRRGRMNKRTRRSMRS